MRKLNRIVVVAAACIVIVDVSSALYLSRSKHRHPDLREIATVAHEDGYAEESTHQKRIRSAAVSGIYSKQKNGRLRDLTEELGLSLKSRRKSWLQFVVGWRRT
jgi:hypothetical protein